MSNILTLQTEGTSLAPRYSIMNELGWYYNEEEDSWVNVVDVDDPTTLSKSKDRPRYTLYSSPNIACEKIQELTIKKFEKLPVRNFVAPFIVELYTDKPVTKTQVQDWLHQVIRVASDFTRKGLGPVDDSYGHMSIDWTKLKETTPGDIFID